MLTPSPFTAVLRAMDISSDVKRGESATARSIAASVSIARCEGSEGHFRRPVIEEVCEMPLKRLLSPSEMVSFPFLSLVGLLFGFCYKGDQTLVALVDRL